LCRGLALVQILRTRRHRYRQRHHRERSKAPPKHPVHHAPQRSLLHALGTDIPDKAVKITAAGARGHRLKDRTGTNMIQSGAPGLMREQQSERRTAFKSSQETGMTDLSSLSSSELADRIAIVRDNIRQITEQAAAASGAADEERNADRLAEQNEELDALLKEEARRSRK